MKLYIILSTIFFTNYLFADAYESGKKIYKQKGCGACHGTRLEGMNMYPYLANRSKGFLSYKLKRFRSQEADNQQQEMMIPFAMGLSDEQIDHLTTYMNSYIDEQNSQRYDDSYQVHGDGGS